VLRDSRVEVFLRGFLELRVFVDRAARAYCPCCRRLASVFFVFLASAPAVSVFSEVSFYHFLLGLGVFFVVYSGVFARNVVAARVLVQGEGFLPGVEVFVESV